MRHQLRRRQTALRRALPTPRYWSRRSTCASATFRRSDEISGALAFAAAFLTAGAFPETRFTAGLAAFAGALFALLFAAIT
jgi:hypothetical protein